MGVSDFLLEQIRHNPAPQKDNPLVNMGRQLLAMNEENKIVQRQRHTPFSIDRGPCV